MGSGKLPSQVGLNFAGTLAFSFFRVPFHPTCPRARIDISLSRVSANYISPLSNYFYPIAPIRPLTSPYPGLERTPHGHPVLPKFRQRG
jgi:hypothetical protein